MVEVEEKDTALTSPEAEREDFETRPVGRYYLRLKRRKKIKIPNLPKMKMTKKMSVSVPSPKIKLKLPPAKKLRKKGLRIVLPQSSGVRIKRRYAKPF